HGALDAMLAAEVADEGGPVGTRLVAEAEGRRVMPVEEDDALQPAFDRRERSGFLGTQRGELLATRDDTVAPPHLRGEALSGLLADLVDREEAALQLPARLHDGLGEGMLRIDLDAGDEAQHFAGIDARRGGMPRQFGPSIGERAGLVEDDG